MVKSAARLVCVSGLAVAAGVGGTALAGPGFTLSVLVREGESVPGVGVVTTVDNVAVNNSGQWRVESDTNAAADIDGVILGPSGVVQQHGVPLAAPAGTAVSSFDDLTLNNNGDSSGNWFLSGATTSTDSGIFFNSTLVFQEGAISTAAGFSANTPYIGFFGTKINDNNQILVVASIDDPAIATTVDRAMVRLDYNATLGTYTETVLAKEADVLGGTSVVDFSTNSECFAMNSSGTVMYCAEMTPATVDSIYVGAAEVMREGQDSVITGRNWELLNDRALDLNNAGQWVVKANITGATTDDEMIVRGGAPDPISIVAQEGQSIAAISPFTFVGFGSGPVMIDDNGNVWYYATWNSPTTTQNKGLFRNGELIIQDGVTVIGSDTVTTVRGIGDGFAVSDNGRYAIVRVVLGTSTDAAILVTVGPVCGTSDFDGDGDFGTDADIEAFFACLGGNCCALCFGGGSDFDGDGDSGTDADIEAFFRVLGGGAC